MERNKTEFNTFHKNTKTEFLFSDESGQLGLKNNSIQSKTRTRLLEYQRNQRIYYNILGVFDNISVLSQTVQDPISCDRTAALVYSTN